MLIRSQNKKMLLNIDGIRSFFVTESLEHEGKWDIMAKRLPELGSYSTEEKAIKVLDMVQRAYADSELTKFTIPEIERMFKEESPSRKNKLLAETMAEVLASGMVFQMPADEEVTE